MTTQQSNEDRIRKVIAEQLGIALSRIHANSHFIEELGADSLDLVELVMAIEKELDIDIPDEDAGDINTLQDALDWITNHP